MNVLIATGIYPPDIGGPATYSEALARELRAHSYTVTVATYDSRRIENKESGIKVLRISRRWPLPIRYAYYAWTILLMGRTVDIIYAQDSVSAGLPALIANWFLRKPFVLKVVGDYAWEQSQLQIADCRLQILDEFLKIKPKGKIRILWEIERFVAHHADTIIVPSNYLKGVVEKWGIRSDKIEVIYNSFDWDSVSLARVSGEVPAHDIIYSVGRLVPWKGFDTLIEMMPDVLKERPNTELVIYGDGPERKNLESRIKKLGMEKYIKLLGRIDHVKLLEALQGERKFFVLNSSYEGMSHQILECQALKIPCAVSNAGGNPEIVKDGETGLLFAHNNKEQIKNAIIKLLNDQTLVRYIKEKAYAQIKERHDFNNMIEQTIKVLQNTL